MSTNISPALLERVEAEAFFAVEEAAPSATRGALGMASLRIGGGVALAMRNDPTRFWSKVLGLGFEQPVTAELIGEVCGFYRSHGAAYATLEIAPDVLPADWPEICARLNLTPGGTLVKLAIDVDTAVARLDDSAQPAPRVSPEQVKPDQALAWASVQVESFGMPRDGLAEMAAATVGQPNWYQVGVWADGYLVGAAAMYTFEGAAHMFGAGTLPNARRRGGQTAMLAARVRAAQAAGCRWIVGETSVEAPGEHNPSLHNMMRAGLEPRYERRIWNWRDGEAGQEA
jgi:hypothetical protein